MLIKYFQLALMQTNLFNIVTSMVYPDLWFTMFQLPDISRFSCTSMKNLLKSLQVRVLGHSKSANFNFNNASDSGYSWTAMNRIKDMLQHSSPHFCVKTTLREKLIAFSFFHSSESATLKNVFFKNKILPFISFRCKYSAFDYQFNSQTLYSYTVFPLQKNTVYIKRLSLFVV